MEVVLQKATRQHTKQHNSRLVLRAIYDYGQISRAELARMTRLTRATISEVVAELMRNGLVEEIGHAPIAVGRTPVLLSVDANARQLITIDVANGELRGAVINLRGSICHRINLSLQQHHGAAIVALVYEAIDTLLGHTTSPLLGIGIGTPGLVDPAGGVRQAVNLGWYNLPLRDLVQTRYGVAVHVANDSQLAALAEYSFGAQRTTENMIVVLAGRGVGAGIVLNGRLFTGDAGSAGEIGHVVVVEQGLPCRCGNHGCLETIASSRAITQQAVGIARAETTSSLHEIVAGGTDLTLDHVRHALVAGDKSVQQLVQQVGHHLGAVIAEMVGMLNIQCVLIAGQVATLGAPLLEAARHAVQSRSLPMLARDTEIHIAPLGLDTVMLGAAALLLSSELGLSGKRCEREGHFVQPAFGRTSSVAQAL